MTVPAVPSSQNFIRVSFPADFAYLSILGPCLHALLQTVNALEDNLPNAMELAVYEACTNIVEHAYKGMPGLIDMVLTLETQPKRLIVDLYDTGRTFDMTQVPQPDFEDPQEHGYGLFLVHQIMDDVVYKPENGNNHWRLVKNL